MPELHWSVPVLLVSTQGGEINELRLNANETRRLEDFFISEGMDGCVSRSRVLDEDGEAVGDHLVLTRDAFVHGVIGEPRSTFWVIGHRQEASRYVTVFGSHWGLRTDPEPGSVSTMGSKFTSPERALAVYDALEADMFGRSGHVYEVTVGPHSVGFEYVAGPLNEQAPPAVAAVDPRLAMSPLSASSAASASPGRGSAVGL